MPRVLVSGSVSYDTLLQVDTDMRDTLRGSTGALSVGYHCSDRHQTFGGIAANISFHLASLGVEALPVAAVGNDFEQYAAWMDLNDVDQSLLLHVDSEPTAQVYILSDAVENQILALYLGAMAYSKDICLGHEKADLVVIGPDERTAFMKRVEDFRQFDAPVMLDPGQCVTSLSADDFRQALSVSRWLIVNEFECAFLESLTKMTTRDLADQVEALIVTRGADGARILTNGEVTDVDAVPPVRIADPTGCGDSFRAGLISALLSGQNISEAAHQGAALASETMAHIGAQWQRIAR